MNDLETYGGAFFMSYVEEEEIRCLPIALEFCFFLIKIIKERITSSESTVLRRETKSKDNLVHILGNLITNLAPGLYQKKNSTS